MHPPQQPSQWPGQQQPYGQPTQQYTQPGPPPGWQPPPGPPHQQPWQEVGDSRTARHPYLQPPPPPKSSGKGKAFAVLGGLLVVLALLGGLVKLTSDDGEPAAATATPSAGGNRTAEPSQTTVPVSEVPQPTAQQARRLRAELRLIDPGLDHERSIGRARNSCWDLLNGMDRTEVANRTQQRFDGGSASIDIIDADQILGVIEATFCH